MQGAFGFWIYYSVLFFGGYLKNVRRGLLKRSGRGLPYGLQKCCEDQPQGSDAERTEHDAEHEAGRGIDEANEGARQ
jgi:hypothetical protein